jgi:hypothetical protein
MKRNARDAIAVAIRQAATEVATYHEGADRVLAALAEQGYTVAKLREVPGAGWRSEFGDVGLWPFETPAGVEPIFRITEKVVTQ